MKRFLFTAFAVFFCFAQIISAQIPTTTLVQIVRAEDERRFDVTLENLLKSSDAKIRARAALAAGRIGDENSIPALVNLLKDSSIEVQTMAMFALGEIESPKAANAILEVLKTRGNNSVRARALEAAGKIAAANPKDTNAPELGKAIVSTLNSELTRRPPNYETILLGETAVLRARPANGEELMIKLLSEPNARIRADALNTLARLRSKIANNKARELLQKDSDPIVRANAARMLGIGEDKSAIDLLLNAALKDADSRVRVSAIRALGSLKDAKVADALLSRAEKLLREYAFAKTTYNYNYPQEKNELLEISTALGRILENSNNEQAISIFEKFCELHEYCPLEAEIALAKISPVRYVEKFSPLLSVKSESPIYPGFLRTKGDKALPVSGVEQALGELSNNPNEEIKIKAEKISRFILKNFIISEIEIPDSLRAFAKFKSSDLNEILRLSLKSEDIFIRAAAAELLGEQPATKENIEALKKAFDSALITDKDYNDAQLAILDALYKLDKRAAVETFLVALDASDYLVRRKAFEILKDADLQQSFPGIQASLENFMAQKKNQVLPYNPAFGTKLGQILNANADYVRAVSRKNGTVKAILTTKKGNFTIDFFPEDAPLTVDNFIKLARANYFNGIEAHRVVPNFVMQDGDPRGDGNGGPGWEIRDEINMVPYERGAVGMALSGKDTGGSQWFVTHSPQPHLDGGYTVFGRVNKSDMKIVDTIVRGDKILSVKIVESNLPQRTQRKKN